MRTYKSDLSSDVFDVAMRKYGSLAGLSRLLADNPGLVQEDGTIAQYGVTHVVGAAEAPATELEKAAQTSAPLERLPQGPVYYSNVQQTVFDVALMQYGSVGGLAILLADNPDLVRDNGAVRQFRINHKVQPSRATDLRLKRRMLPLVPATAGAPLDNQPWITEAEQPWITQAEEPWITDTDN